MNHILIRTGLLAGLLLLSACTAGMEGAPGRFAATLEDGTERILDQVCPLPAAGPNLRAPDAGMTARMQVLRAELVLAAVAGHAAAGIGAYGSAMDATPDALLVLERLRVAHAALSAMQAAVEAGDYLYPMYRTDFFIAAGHSADAALRPAMRSAAHLLTLRSGSPDLLKRSAGMLRLLLQDTLYVHAITQSCQELARVLGDAGGELAPAAPDPARYRAALAFTAARSQSRCEWLAATARLPAAMGSGLYCTRLPP